MKQTSPYEKARAWGWYYSPIISIGTIFVLLFAFLWWASDRQDERKQRCEEARGVYLYHEGKCVEGIREIHP